MDAKTASAVMANVFGREGLMKQEGRTVILATHSGMLQFQNLKDLKLIKSVEWLQDADQVIYLKAPGDIRVYTEPDDIFGFSEYVMRYLPPFSSESRSAELRIDKEPLIIQLEIDEMIAAERSNSALQDFPFQHCGRMLQWLMIISIAIVAISERFPSMFGTIQSLSLPLTHP